MFRFIIYPFIPSGCFELPKSAPIYAAPFNSGSLACRNRRAKCGYEFTVESILHDIPEVRPFVSFSPCFRHFIEAISVSVVVLGIAPLKVACSIIVFVLVNVINTREIIWIRNKRQSNKPMDTNIFSSAITMNRKVSPLLFWFENLLLPRVPVINAHYVAKITNQIQILISRSGFPNFTHNSLCFNMLNIRNNTQKNKYHDLAYSVVGTIALWLIK